MKLRILGCSGGIGGRHLRTTALLLDHDVLIDAGTGVTDLAMDELAAIDHVFITHTHLDHIACLPLLIDTVGDRRAGPLTVYGTEAVIATLKQHIFNWAVWPDFSVIPRADNPFLRFRTIEVGRVVILEGRRITPLPVDHIVPAVGYHLESSLGSLVFSGDTGSCDAFWQAVNGIHNLKYMIVECAFSNGEERLARISKHLCPSLLAAELQKLESACDLYITHLKPGRIESTMAEIAASLGEFNPRMLENNQILEF